MSNREKDRNSAKKKIIAGIAAAAVALAGIGLGAHYIDSRAKNDDQQFGDKGEWGQDTDDYNAMLDTGDKQYVTHDEFDSYILVGTDKNTVDKGEGFNGDMADFIAYLLIDDTTQKYAIYQIDRNSMVEMAVMNEKGNFDDYVPQQLCIAHWYGKTEEDRNNNLVSAVSDVLGGMDVYGYFVLNMKDIGTVNDAIGGVVVTIEEDMTRVDPAFKEGASVLLTDKQAEKYLRARMDVGDGTNAGRMKRQRQYIQNAYNMIISQLRENPEYVNDLYNQLTDIVDSDSTGKDISNIAQKLINYQSMGIITFDGETKLNDTIGEGKIHEEFYVDMNSVFSGLSKVMNFTEYTETENDGDADADSEDESGLIEDGSKDEADKD